MKEASYFGQRQLSVCWSQADHLFLSRKILGEENDFKLKKSTRIFSDACSCSIRKRRQGSLSPKSDKVHPFWLAAC